MTLLLRRPLSHFKEICKTELMLITGSKCGKRVNIGLSPRSGEQDLKYLSHLLPFDFGLILKMLILKC